MASRAVQGGPTAAEPTPVVPEPTPGPENTDLALTRTGEENGRIVGILTTPNGTFRMTATPAAWAESEADVAAGRNPMLLDTLLTDPDTAKEIDS